jgi:metal transporter CNNM
MTWAVITDPEGEPQLVLNVDEYLRGAVLAPERFDPWRCSHRPIIVRNRHTRLGELIPRYRARRKTTDDDIVDDDVILLWDDAPRIVTGTDILGRLLRGIAQPATAG